MCGGMAAAIEHKKTMSNDMIFSNWCGWWDLNPHEVALSGF